MDLRFTEDEIAFRDEIRAFLAQNLREEVRQCLVDAKAGCCRPHEFFMPDRLGKALREA